MQAQPDADDEQAHDTVPMDPGESSTHGVRVAYLEPLGRCGDRVRIGAEPLVVGRASSCALRIDDRRVSAQHAQLQATDNGVCVRDLCSTNGTFVDDRRTDLAWLSAPAILTFGTTSYRVVFGDLESDGAPSPRSFGDLIGRAPAMLELFAVVGRVAPTGSAVLLRGEPGTGKDRLAHAIHAASRRSQGPFVSVHAASLRASGAHAQLFGDTRGASAGEEAHPSGLFAQAHGGTLFLKEVGDLPRALQAKILGVLETKRVHPLGGRPQPVDVRIVAATTSDLDEACRRGTFRRDLLRRIAGVRLQVPALRDRGEDLELLARELCGELHRDRGLPAAWLDPEALSVLAAYAWPGNLPELKHVLEQALVETQGTVIRREALEHALRVQQGSASTPAADALAVSVKDRIKRAWQDNLRNLYRQYDGNISRIASVAGLDRRTVRKTLQDMGEHPPRKERNRGDG
ncbi:MAG: sigma 54-interacting transcriptional regulator [Polyangiaceae bacterium]